MKTLAQLLTVATFILQTSLSAAPAPAPVSTDPVITDVGQHHRVWTRTNIVTLSNGRTRTNSASYVELGSGMHRWSVESNRWIDAEAIIEIEANTAVSRKTAHAVAFAANANTPGAISLVTPDGKTLRSHVIGIAFFDAANGHSEMIGTIQDSIGVLLAPNVVIYSNAFDGVKADIRYTQQLGSFEQEIIIMDNPPLPDGFAPDTTRLECWTEFIEYPAATLIQRAVAGMTDETLDFGAFQTGPGRAFALSGDPYPARFASVAKLWVTAENRTFLVEAVRYNQVKRYLDTLPAPGNQAALRRHHANAQFAAAGDRSFPAAPRPRAKAPEERFRMAALKSQRSTFPSQLRGFVLDYTLYGSLTNFTFQCDTTYYASNTVNIYGCTVEGGTVVKFAKTNTAQLNLNGAVTWATAQYRPAILTAKDDDSVGDAVSGSTGSPTGYYGGYFAKLENAGVVENVRFSYAKGGIDVGSHEITLRHAQFLHCSNAVFKSGAGLSPEFVLENVLFYDNEKVRVGGCYLTARQVTVRHCLYFLFDPDYTSNGNIYNSLIDSYSSWGDTAATVNNTADDLDDSYFQTVGAAAHYLSSNSVLRNAGSTNAFSATLLSDLRKRTTYPPIVLTNLVIQNQDIYLAPQAQRDLDTLDLGYHYDPLDYVAVGNYVENSIITLAAGTALGLCATSVNYSISLLNGGRLVTDVSGGAKVG